MHVCAKQLCLRLTMSVAHPAYGSSILPVEDLIAGMVIGIAYVLLIDWQVNQHKAWTYT